MTILAVAHRVVEHAAVSGGVLHHDAAHIVAVLEGRLVGDLDGEAQPVRACLADRDRLREALVLQQPTRSNPG